MSPSRGRTVPGNLLGVHAGRALRDQRGYTRGSIVSKGQSRWRPQCPGGSGERASKLNPSCPGVRISLGATSGSPVATPSRGQCGIACLRVLQIVL